MSTWLRNVGTFLEQLDDTAAVVVAQRTEENFANREDDDDDVDLYTRDVLAAHGLVEQEAEEGEDALINKEDQSDLEGGMVEALIQPDRDLEVVPLEESSQGIVSSASRMQPSDDRNPSVETWNNNNNASTSGAGSNHESDTATNTPPHLVVLQPNETSAAVTEDENPEETPQFSLSTGDTATTTTNSSPEKSLTNADITEETATTPLQEAYHTPKQFPIAATTTTTTTTTVPSSLLDQQESDDKQQQQQEVLNQNKRRFQELEATIQNLQQKITTLTLEKKQQVAAISKEARTLRRHSTTLQDQLTAAHVEIEAQRGELDSAAQRLESNRLQQKQDSQNMTAKHAAELQQAQRALLETKTAAYEREQQLVAEMQQELRAMQVQLQQEGGDWHKELADAVQREQAAQLQLGVLLNEKETFLSQIATLQSQQEGLGSRLESLTAAGDHAAQREREAEYRLDQALELHARQVNQRQLREAELERTVAELSAALAMATRSADDKATQQLNAMDNVGTSASFAATLDSTTKNQSPGDETGQDSHCLLELESLRSYLEQERQQSATLQNELAEMAQERAMEERDTQKRQLQHDRNVAELSAQIAELRAAVREAEQSASAATNAIAESAFENRRVHSLSEEIVRLRDRHSSSQSEIAALRTRLQDALNRATIAEASAETMYPSGSGAVRGDSDMWQATLTSSDNDDDPEPGVRRRGGGTIRRSHQRRKAENQETSMRAALSIDNLPVGNTSSKQRIGKGLDILDSFLGESGKILRFNPMARLIFGKHCWCFLLFREV